jgi:hypothetical protein
MWHTMRVQFYEYLVAVIKVFHASLSDTLVLYDLNEQTNNGMLDLPGQSWRRSRFSARDATLVLSMRIWKLRVPV